ncbi:HpcH/HpaI aldolase/citrate lyase family protein [Nocardioides montaniterrae]
MVSTSSTTDGQFKPLRSVLYMPSSNERALEKAKTLPADAIIFDLEDAVAPDAKVDGRAKAAAAVTSGEYGKRQLIIRVNGIGTEWHDADIKAAAAAGPDVVLVPKVNSAEEVQQLVAALEAAGAPEKTKLWAMVETPIGMINAYAIATASPRLTGFVMGTNDLVKELYAEHVPGRAPILPSLHHALIAARAAGIVIIDGVYNDVKNLEGFQAEVEQGRQMGFDGKTLIHPGQVEPANAGFAPSEAAITDARGLIEAFESSTGGVVTYNNKMVENLHVESAKRTLSIAEAIAALQD